MTSTSTHPRNFVVADFVPTDALCLLGVILCCFTGFAEAAKYLHGLRLLFLALEIAVFAAAAMVWLRVRHLNSAYELRTRWLFFTWAAFALIFAVLHPISQRHVLGVGSDREDALRVADFTLLHGRYLYDAPTYLGNAITPLPGAVMLSLPFYFLGSVAIQNLFWLALFLAFVAWFFRDRSTALIMALLTFAAYTTNLDDFLVGGDYFINALYVCIAFALTLVTVEEDMPGWMQLAAAIFLGFAICSRPIYVVAFPLLLAYLWQRRGPAPAMRALLVSGCTAVLLSLPFYLYSPAHFAPLHLRHKLDFIPARYHATIALPALGLLVACIGFFIRLTRPRVYLLFGLSLFAMVGIPGWIEWFQNPFTLGGWYGVGLSAVPSLFFMLWILAHYQQTARRLRKSA